MNKYPLMGQYVEVKKYLKPAKRFSARNHEPVILEESRVGMVVGYRTVFDGITHPGRQGGGYYDNDDYEPPWFEATEKIQVLLVCFWPRYKPVLVRPVDVLTVNMMEWPSFKQKYRPTSLPYPNDLKDYLRDIMKDVPRDQRGRWCRC
ncbi:hypothetical protein EHM76_00530 [bacterium]|nr:MAG: hypothetical protein EHM76_00530 [bacterium]